jgi:hypothetical protein
VRSISLAHDLTNLQEFNMAGIVEPHFVEVGATVLTSTFQVRGKLRILGIMQTFLNDEQKPTLIVYGADVIGFSVTNPVGRMSQPEVVVAKPDAAIVALEAIPPQGQLTLQPHTEQLMLFTDRFAVAGKFHMGQDARLADFAESALQQFIVASDVKIYPLFQARPGLAQAAPLALVHRSQVRLYYKG